MYAETQKNENFIKNQKNFLEVVVDFLLNIRENSSLRNKYNYDNKVCSVEFLRLFSKTLKSSKLLDYFIINISEYCLKFKISNYLTDFIKNCFIKVKNKSKQDPIDTFIYSSHIINLIKSTKDFDLELNTEINNLIDDLHKKFLKYEKSDDLKQVASNFLMGLTQTLCCLYNEESAFYDENNILKIVLNSLKNTIEHDYFVCWVCLNCLAYKSNLIDNIEVERVYENLKKVSIS